MHSRSILAISALIMLVSAIWWGHDLRRPIIKADKQIETVTFQSDIIKFFSFGMKRAIADLIWVQTLVESDLEQYKVQDLNSWLYLRFLTIISIDPKFYEAYRFGGQYLMVVKDDLLGADDLMNRGLLIYPTDYFLNWQLGFLHAIEMDDVPGSYVYFERIKDHPLRPGFFESFYTKVVAQKLGPEEAFQVAYELWKNSPEESATKKRMATYLYSFQAEIDLACLNQNFSHCRKTDFNNRPYLQNADGTWRALEKVREVRLKPKEKGSP